MFWLVPPQTQDHPRADSRAGFSLGRYSLASPPPPCSSHWALPVLRVILPVCKLRGKPGPFTSANGPHEMEGLPPNASRGRFTAHCWNLTPFSLDNHFSYLNIIINMLCLLTAVFPLIILKPTRESLFFSRSRFLPSDFQL